MDVDPNTGLPMGLAPVHADVRKKNEFKIWAIFPFKTWRSLPSLSTALLNVSISAGTLIVSLASLAVSIAVFLPIGTIKTVGEGIWFVTGRWWSSDDGANDRRRCVVINGAR
jgi:hypothetical protein